MAQSQRCVSQRHQSTPPAGVLPIVIVSSPLQWWSRISPPPSSPTPFSTVECTACLSVCVLIVVARNSTAGSSPSRASAMVVNGSARSRSSELILARMVLIGMGLEVGCRWWKGLVIRSIWLGGTLHWCLLLFYTCSFNCFSSFLRLAFSESALFWRLISIFLLIESMLISTFFSWA